MIQSIFAFTSNATSACPFSSDRCSDRVPSEFNSLTRRHSLPALTLAPRSRRRLYLHRARSRKKKISHLPHDDNNEQCQESRVELGPGLSWRAPLVKLTLGSFPFHPLYPTVLWPGLFSLLVEILDWSIAGGSDVRSRGLQALRLRDPGETDRDKLPARSGALSHGGQLVACPLQACTRTSVAPMALRSRQLPIHLCSWDRAVLVQCCPPGVLVSERRSESRQK